MLYIRTHGGALCIYGISERASPNLFLFSTWGERECKYAKQVVGARYVVVLLRSLVSSSSLFEIRGFGNGWGIERGVDYILHAEKIARIPSI